MTSRAVALLVGLLACRSERPAPTAEATGGRDATAVVSPIDAPSLDAAVSATAPNGKHADVPLRSQPITEPHRADDDPERRAADAARAAEYRDRVLGTDPQTLGERAGLDVDAAPAGGGVDAGVGLRTAP